MKELLHDLFAELGLPEHSKEVMNCTHKFTLKTYMQIFEHLIKSKDLIVSQERAEEMFQEYREKKWNNFYGMVC